MYDCIIIGTGPAGISAALTLKARNKTFLWFGNPNLSLKVEKAEKIANYPGLINVSGEEMSAVFKKQIEEAGIEITNRVITGVYDMGSYYGLLANQDMWEAKTIILCTGVAPSRPLPGEEENLGRGVSYCATCDGFLYKGKEIAVVVQDASYLEEVDYLANLAAKVYLIPLYKDCSYSKDNVEVISKRPTEIKKNNGIDVFFKEEVLHVAGCFFLKSSVSAGVLVPGIKTEGAHVIVDRACKTNLKGCFAAGDITGTPYQYAKAVGEGNIAAHGVVSYLASLKDEEKK